MARKESEEHWEQLLRSLGHAVLGIQRCTAGGAAEGPELVELRIKLEQDNATSVLVVLKARGREGMLVGFVGGSTLTDVMLSTAKKLRAGGVRWREERPWVP